MIVDKTGDADNITLKVELAEDIADPAMAELKAVLATQLRLKTNLGYNLEFFPLNSLPRYEVKARRFKDLRKKER